MTGVAIGVDIGGSRIKLVAVDRSRQVYLHDAVATLALGSQPEAFSKNLISATRSFVDRLDPRLQVEGFGFALPCYTIGEDWVLGEVTNLPSLEGYPLRPPLLEAFGPRITTTYDTNAAGLAEFIWGAGAPAERMLFMGIGTGISASFFTRQAGMVSFTYQTLGDTGHIIVDPDGEPPCPCGGRGCLEAVAAAPAIRRYALEAVAAGATRLGERLAQNGDLTARDVAELAGAGDPQAAAILERVGRYLGIALTSYLHIFLPDWIVLGGGVAAAGEPLFAPIRQTLGRLGSPWYLKRFRGIVPSAFGPEAGAVGSACLVFFPGVIDPTHHRSEEL